jgi:hypothetical protein
MQFFRLQKATLAAVVALPFLFSAGFFLFVGAPAAHAQSNLAGDIAGTVTDPSGAAIVGATVKATSQETGAVATATTSATGAYRFSLLKPATYALSASAKGFKATATVVTVSVGQITTQDLRLAVGAATETIEVNATTQLLQTDTAQLSTAVSMQQLENIPNPGSDITYTAQAKPGVVMNTGANSATGALGYGNFSAYGLPGVSNNFTVNGMEVNDPFLNLNNSGPSNLLLGMNDMQETDVITNAYEVEYGTLAGVQLNSISRSGSDKFHGNFNWYWNGRSMNADNWYNKNPNYDGGTVINRPFSNFNQWAAAVGGPIKKDKAFFFVNTEGISFIASTQDIVYVPDPGFESSVIGTNSSCSDATSSLYEAGYAGECSFYKTMFALYNAAPGASTAGESATDPGALQYSAATRFSMTEWMLTARVDANLTANDKMFGHFKYDKGTQPSYSDPINSAFDADSVQPDWEGQFAETHSFGTKAVNQFLATGSYYSAIFVNKNPTLELATFPFDLYWYDGFVNNLNNNAPAWPEGRNVTQWQLGDDFSYTVGKHTLKAGVALKKDDISDFDPLILTVPEVLTDAAYGDFQNGQALLGVQNFPTKPGLPLSLYTLGFYAEDIYKPVAKMTVTAGVRLERNSNVSCRNNCLSNLGGDFFNLARSAPLNSTSYAYNTQFKYGLPNAFTNYQNFAFEPRVGFTYSLSSKTVVRGGVGFFTDVFPGTIADAMLDNPPLTTSWTVYGATASTASVTYPAVALEPSDPTSVQSRAISDNATFQSGFKSGGSFASECTANANICTVPPTLTTVQVPLHYPMYEEWNLQIQQAFTHTQSIQIGYVGNHGYHEPDQNVGANAFGGYGLPVAASPAPSFGEVNEIGSNAVSNYAGLVVSYLFQGHGLNAQLNYTWSHALDEISNGGVLPFNTGSLYVQQNPYNLRQNYGNSDYDVPQNFSANYLYAMPYFGGPRALTGDWQIGGTLFFNGGSPFTPEAYVSDYGIGNDGNGAEVVALAPKPGVNHHCTASATNPATPCITPADFTYSMPFGAAERNQFWGPHFFDTDMTVQKGFKLPHMGDQGKFEAGMTAFNLFNHPSFGLPVGLFDSSHFGKILYAEGPPTTIYGSGLGGDPTIRIVEFTGKFIF